MTTLTYALESQNFSEDELRSYDAIATREFYQGQFNAIPTNGRYDIRLEKGFCHPISVMEWDSGMYTSYRRTWQHIRENSIDVYALWAIESGSLRVTQSNGTTSIPLSNLSLLSSQEAFFAEAMPNHESSFKAKIAVIPGHIFRSYIAQCKDFLGMSVNADTGEGRIIRDILSILYEEGDNISTKSADELIAQALRSLQRITQDPHLGIKPKLTLKEAHLRKIENCIDFNLTDPDISSSAIAKKCGISVRYLYYLLKENGTSFSTLIWSKRLAKSKEWILSPEMRRHTITEIAFMTGFKHTAHFSRAFRKEFGDPPQRFRTASLERQNVPESPQSCRTAPC
jgi:AraC family transcriptional activator of tynA and feaB